MKAADIISYVILFSTAGLWLIYSCKMLIEAHKKSRDKSRKAKKDMQKQISDIDMKTSYCLMTIRSLLIAQCFLMQEKMELEVENENFEQAKFIRDIINTMKSQVDAINIVTKLD